MAERKRLPDSIAALLFGVVAALPMLALCVVLATVLAQQVLVSGAPADWAVPALATMLSVLGSLGPVGFFNETAEGAIGLGIETVLLPWAIVAAAPMVLIARQVGRGASESRLAELAFAIGYGLAAGIGSGVLATWSATAEPGLQLPVSPDLVAARSALIALVAVAIVRLPERLGQLAAAVRPVVLGGFALLLGTIALWLIGLLVAIAQAPTETRQGVTTAGSLLGANLSIASFYSSLGVDSGLSVGSGLTGSVEQFTLAGATGLPDAAVALIGTAFSMLLVIPAMRIAIRRSPATLPPIASILGVALGFSGVGAAMAVLISGGLDLLILPIEGTQRTFAEVRLDISAAEVFTQLGARAVFAGLPFLLVRERLSTPAGSETSNTMTSESIKVAHDV